MPFDKNQLPRLQAIHNLLNTSIGRTFTILELQDALRKINVDFVVSAKTLSVDKMRLREYGSPIPDDKLGYRYTHHVSFLKGLSNSDESKMAEFKAILEQLKGMNKIDLFIGKINEVLAAIGENTENVIQFDDRLNLNRDLLPQLSEYIKTKKVISITFQDVSKEKRKDIFHPYLLKEFNQKWYIFGYNETWQKEKPERTTKIFNIEIGGIRGVEPLDEAFEINDWWFATEHFSEIVGVTHLGSPLENVKIRLWNLALAPYLENPRIHQSQDVCDEEESNEFEDYTFRLSINHEFKNELFKWNDYIEVLEPAHLRAEFKERAEKMAAHYK